MTTKIKLPYDISVYAKATNWCLMNLGQQAQFRWTVSTNYVWHCSYGETSEGMIWTFLNEQDAVLFSLIFS
jgi:hypothetical protein